MSNVISGPYSVMQLSGGLFELVWALLGPDYCIHELISLSVSQSADSLAEVTSGLRGDCDHSYLDSNIINFYVHRYVCIIFIWCVFRLCLYSGFWVSVLQ